MKRTKIREQVVSLLLVSICNLFLFFLQVILIFFFLLYAGCQQYFP